MFIKLTRFDNRPVWLNASFIVTVEPRRDGNGAVVVPIGDGLDYDVRETPAEVLKLLEGAPEPKVVPVPVSDCLTKTPVDVSPEPEKKDPPPPPPSAPAAPVASAEESVPQVEESGKKPRKRTTRKTVKSAAEKKPRAAKKASEPAAEAPVPPPAPAKLELSDDQIARLRKMAPKSLAKIKNTLATQFHVADVGGTVTALAERGVYTIDGNHINWTTEPAEA